MDVIKTENVCKFCGEPSDFPLTASGKCYHCFSLDMEKRGDRMEKIVSLKVNSFDDKEKLITALASNGYLVGAELEKDKFVTSRTNGWRIDVYKKV